jgi:ribosomal 50S subunit-recycling heat shock protein
MEILNASGNVIVNGKENKKGTKIQLNFGDEITLKLPKRISYVRFICLLSYINIILLRYFKN